MTKFLLVHTEGKADLLYKENHINSSIHSAVSQHRRLMTVAVMLLLIRSICKWSITAGKCYILYATKGGPPTAIVVYKGVRK